MLAGRLLTRTADLLAAAGDAGQWKALAIFAGLGFKPSPERRCCCASLLDFANKTGIISAVSWQ